MIFPASSQADQSASTAESGGADAAAPAPTRHQVRAAEHRAMAAEARRSAAASNLDNVREKFERAAQVWTDLAVADETTARSLAVRLGPAARN